MPVPSMPQILLDDAARRSQFLSGLPIRYLCLRIDLTDDEPTQAAIRPFPAVYPGTTTTTTTTTTDARNKAEKYGEGVRTMIATMGDGRDIREVKSWLGSESEVHVGVKEALKLYELGWLAIRYLSSPGHGHTPQQQEIWGVQNRYGDDKEETEEDKKFVIEVMGDEASIHWMREILRGVAAQAQAMAMAMAMAKES